LPGSSSPLTGHYHRGPDNRDEEERILGLKWDYIKPDNRFIILPITKNNTVRVVPMNDTLLQALMDLPRESEFVFWNARGKHLGDVKRSFATACRGAGIENFRFHDLPAAHLRKPFSHEGSSHESPARTPGA
jgi:integrase